MNLEQLTISLTYRCNSRCLSCLKWKTPRKEERKELKTEEYQKIFKSWDKQIPYLSFVGGEAFLRDDLPQIVISAINALRTKMVNLATNGLFPGKIASDIKKILATSPKSIIIANLSIDGVEKIHNHTRGGKKFFKKLMKTYRKLKYLQKKYPNLQIAFHTGISKLNKNSIPKLLNFLSKLRVGSYILEPCLDREELLKKGIKIQITPGEFKKIIKKNWLRIWRLNYSYNLILRLGRMGYYSFAREAMEKKHQIIPCQAVQTSLFLDPYGNLSPCEFRDSFVNLADSNYNLKKVYFSEIADKTKKEIQNNQCFCPSSYHYYSSIKKAPFYLLKLFLKSIR